MSGRIGAAMSINVYGLRTSPDEIQASRGYECISAVVNVDVYQSYLRDRVAFHIRIELKQIVASLLGSWFAQTALLQEEVDAQISLSHDSRILNGELPNSGKNEILQSFYTSDARSRVDEEDVSLFQSSLSACCPEAELTIVLLLLGCRDMLNWGRYVSLLCGHIRVRVANVSL